VLLLNPDTVVRRGMLAGLAGYMDANPEVGIAGPKVVGKDGSVLGSARTFPTLRTAFFGGKTLLRKMLGGSGAARYEIPCLYHDCLDPLPVDWVIGACMFIRKSVLDQACLLDERFFMYWEDADLCKRAAEHGWKVYWLPEFEVMHICEAASNASLLAVARTTFEFHRSVYLYFCKHLKSNPLLPLAVFPLVYARMLIKLPITLLREIIKKYLK